MFGFVNVGERAGSGIPNIFRVWREQGWKEPVIAELSEPDRIILSLSLLKKESSDKKVAIKNGDKGTKTASQKIAILEYLTDHASGVAIICDVSRVFREQVANDLVYGVVPFLGQGLEHTPENLAHVLFVIGDVEGQGILIRHGLQLLFKRIFVL